MSERTEFCDWIGEHTLLETHEGRAIYLHSEDCPSFCDFACNGNREKECGEFDRLLAAYGARCARRALEAVVAESIRRATRAGLQGLLVASAAYDEAASCARALAEHPERYAEETT